PLPAPHAATEQVIAPSAHPGRFFFIHCYCKNAILAAMKIGGWDETTGGVGIVGGLGAQCLWYHVRSAGGEGRGAARPGAAVAASDRERGGRQVQGRQAGTWQRHQLAYHRFPRI